MHRRSLLLAFASLAVTLVAAEPKKVIVCTVTTGFRHSSISEAEKTLQMLADTSKAFTVVEWVRQPAIEVPREPRKPRDPAPNADAKAKERHAKETEKYTAEKARWDAEIKPKAQAAQKEFDAAVRKELEKLSPANLAKVDGVIFANTTGDLPLPDNDGFVAWVKAGGAFMGMHSAGDTFHKFPGYLGMIQAEFKTHGPQVPADLVVADRAHPATAGLPNPWDLVQEEMYEFKDGSHDVAKVRSLLYLKHHPVQREVAGHFPVAWNRMHGKGRVFYTSLGHREDLWSADPNLKDRKNPVETAVKYQQHILGGIKWALGLAEGSAEPQKTLP
ncbi:MAG: ThuA domain-containing protein [Chthoniobacteraceae bacterium]